MLHAYQRHLRTSIVLLLCMANFALGYYGGAIPPTSAGSVGVCYLLLLTAQSHHAHDAHRNEDRRDSVVSSVVPPLAEPIAGPVSPAPVTGVKLDDPVEQMLAQSRYALLLRRQIVGYLSDEHFHRSVEALRQAMALVPEGDVEVYTGIDSVADDFSADAGDHSPTPHQCHIEPFFLDRWPVTNGLYYEFVASGGYREIGLWDANIWTAVLDMVDQTGLPGPRFWKNGRFLLGEEDLPVVGVCWHEAAAFARWMCKRLPTDAEWVKAASWPVPIDNGALAHRRFPWGEVMDRLRANVWGSGPSEIVSVRKFAEGSSVGGIYQLTGNVWEWTNGDFDTASSNGRLELAGPMKSIRGGAFDTYFDNQASTRFQSGENPLNRRHNIGFRCAVGIRDVVLQRQPPETPAIGAVGAAAQNEEAAT